MATWHQRNNTAPLWHDTQWTVVEDVGHTCVSRFDTNIQAQAYLNSLSRCGNRKGAYILPPMQHQLSL